MKIIKHLKSEINKASTYNKDKSKTFAEVFTPEPLIKEMLMSLDVDTWTDSTKTIFDRCVGFKHIFIFYV